MCHLKPKWHLFRNAEVLWHDIVHTGDVDTLWQLDECNVSAPQRYLWQDAGRPSTDERRSSENWNIAGTKGEFMSYLTVSSVLYHTWHSNQWHVILDSQFSDMSYLTASSVTCHIWQPVQLHCQVLKGNRLHVIFILTANLCVRSFDRPVNIN